LTDEERAQRRAADRQYAQQAVEQLRSSAGWQQWLQTRAAFRTYSFGNQLLIAMQHPTATRVAGFRAWLKLGYCVRKGETSIRIWAPCPPSKKQLDAWRESGSDPTARPRTFFKLTAVFAQDQVKELPPPGVPAPIDCPYRELDGDDLAEVLPRLVELAGEIGSTVTFAPIDGSAYGYYQPDTKRIVIDTQHSINQQTAVLCHELAHALVRADGRGDDPTLDYASEELVVESVAFTVVLIARDRRRRRLDPLPRGVGGEQRHQRHRADGRAHRPHRQTHRAGNPTGRRRYHGRRGDRRDAGGGGMSTDEHLQLITDTRRQLDTRRHTTPARLQLSHERREGRSGRWVAQILADPLRRPLLAHAVAPITALHSLSQECATLDWQRVKR
jgi:hypothetical protein